MPSRWDLILEQKPIPLLDHLVAEVARLLGKDLARWPPPIEELDPATGEKFAPLLAPDHPRPAAAAYRAALQLARWDLQHDLAAYDDYMRNQRWQEHGLPPGARVELLFLSRWLTEQLLALREATSGRVKQRQLLEILDRLEQQLLGPLARA